MKAVRSAPHDTAHMPAALRVAGIPVVPFETYDHAVACVERTIASNRKSFCVAVNPIKMHHAWHDPNLLHLLQEADVALCDGVGVSIASRVLYGRRVARITGCDLFFRLVELASTKGWGVFLLGASAESNTAARAALQGKYPRLQIAGWCDGYFQDSEKVIEQVNASGAKMLFVALGSPKQEYWIWRHRSAIAASFCMGVGGSFDVASGRLPRAPGFFRATGTEFLFRFTLEPRKRLTHPAILARFLLRVVGLRLTGASESVRWT
jgi:N-acetylglucosaminyldiphosphoundecaprenol N-acetyl-beta-D-mannosaminyltransferase